MVLEGMVMGAIVVLAGEELRGYAARLCRALAGQGWELIAADGGADRLAALGLTPALIVGDGDSLRGEFAAIPRLSLERRKNFTDGAAALSYALEHYEGRVWLLGAMGGRPDHQLANLLLPLEAARRLKPRSAPGQRDWPARRVCLAGESWRACYAGAGRTLIQGRAGDTVSLVPLQAVKGLSLSGLEYPLQDYSANLGDSRTISNVLTDREGEIVFERGMLLIFQIFAACQSEEPDENIALQGE